MSFKVRVIMEAVPKVSKSVVEKDRVLIIKRNPKIPSKVCGESGAQPASKKGQAAG